MLLNRLFSQKNLNFIGKLPFYSLYINHKFPELTPFLKVTSLQMLQTLKNVSEVTENSGFNAIIFSCQCYFHGQNSDEDAKKVLSEYFQLLSVSLQSQVLEKRVNSVRAISSLVNLYSEIRDAVLISQINSVIAEFEVLHWLFSPIHLEVLKCCRDLLEWSRVHSLLPLELLPALWRAAAAQHESTRQQVTAILTQFAADFQADTLFALATELKSMDFRYFDEHFLTFLQEFVKKIRENSGSRAFLQEVLGKLSSAELPQSQKRSEIMADLMMHSMFIEIAAEEFQKHFESEQQTLSSIEFLGMFVEGLRKHEIGLNNFLRPENQFANVCISRLEALLPLPNESERVTAWLQCLDNAAKLYPHRDGNPYLPQSSLTRLWRSVISSDYQEELLVYLGKCTSAWTHALKALVKWMEDTTTLAEVEWMSGLSIPGYEGLMQLVTRVCLQKSDEIFDCYRYETNEISGFDLLIFAAILPERQEVRSHTTSRLLSFLLGVNLSDGFSLVMQTSLNLVLPFPHLADRVLGLVTAMVQMEAKYSESLWHEEDLDHVVDAIVAKKPSWLSFLGIDYIDQMKEHICETAHQHQVPYFCVRLDKPANSSLMFRLCHFRAPDLTSFFTGRSFLPQFVTLVSSLPEEPAFQAWETLTQVLPRTTISSALDSYRQSATLTERLVYLHNNVCSTDHVTELFSFLETPSPKVLQIHGFRLVAYVDKLCELMSRLYWKHHPDVSHVQVVLGLLTTTSMYFAQPTALKRLKTDLFRTTQPLFSHISAQSLLQFSSQLEVLLHFSLFNSPNPHIRQSSLNFFTFLGQKDKSVADFLLFTLQKNCVFVLEKQEIVFEFLSLMLNLVNCWGVSEMPSLETIAEKVSNEDYFSSISDDCKSIFLKLLQEIPTFSHKIPLISTLSAALISQNISEKLRFESILPCLGVYLSDISCQRVFIDCISPVVSNSSWRKRSSKSWRLAAKSTYRQGYVGLINIGAICYISATVQQLRSIPTFSDCVISTQSTGITTNALKALFIRLLYTGKSRAISPEVLITTMSDRINPFEQMDIEEFFDYLMHRLEAEMKDLAVTEHFRGRLIRTLECEQCKARRDNTQDFLTLSVKITGKRNLLEGLRALVQGEWMEEDNAIDCSKCGSAQRCYSTHQLQILPKVLVVSLSRFDFDLRSNKRFKLNDRFEYPEKLDLKAFSVVTEQPSDYYLYTLKGVAVHLGRAEAGHYYSLVKQGEQWVKCDDESVTEYDSSQLETETFGGTGLGCIQSSAYLLFYERDHFYSFRTDTSVITSKYTSVSSLTHTSFLQPKLNKRTYLRLLLSPSFVSFISQLMETNSAELLKFSVVYFLSVHIRSEFFIKSPEILIKLCRKVENNVEISDFLCEILSNSDVINEFFLSSPLPSQKSVILLLFSAAKTASKGKISLLISRFSRKLWDLMGVCKDRSVSAVYEFLWMLLEVGRKEASEGFVAELLVSIVFEIEFSGYEFPLIPPQLPQTDYLGHPLLEEFRGFQPVASQKQHIGYSLSTLNSLITPELAPWLEAALSNYSVWSRFQLSLHFECQQLGRFLSQAYQIVPEGVYQLLVSWLESMSFHSSLHLAGFFDVLHVFLEASNDSAVEYVLSIIHLITICKELETQLVESLYALFASFPTNSAWKNEDLQRFLDSFRPENDYLRVLKGRKVAEFPAVSPRPQSLFELVPPQYNVICDLPNALIVVQGDKESRWLGKEENSVQ